jgi:transcription initiation factor TFIIIB Brf1 subunit/transcription initiation factor TFIIB
MDVCPSCGSDQLEDYYENDDLTFCGNCGNVFDAKTDAEAEAEAEAERFWYEQRNEYYTDEDYEALDREDEGSEFW